MGVPDRAGLFALLHAAGHVESRVESRLVEIGLSLPKMAALRQLVLAGDALPLGQLAERLACVKSNVTQLVDRLEADGLVTRASDPGDRRSRLAVVTDTGRASYRRGVEILQDAEGEIFGVLNPDEATQLHQIIQKLRRA